MKALVFEHGPNDWNYLPREEVSAHLDGIRDGTSHGYLAVMEGRLIGLVTYVVGDAFSRYEQAALDGQPHGWIVEGVVHREYVSQGIGSRLADQCLRALREAGIPRVYAERHEENAASAATMQKAGFSEVDTFYDPARRQSGSRRTTVCRLEFARGNEPSRESRPNDGRQ